MTTNVAASMTTMLPIMCTMEISAPVDRRSIIMSGADATLLHAAARRQGMITLYEDGLRKVVRGETSLEEVLRVTQDQSESGALGAAGADAA